MTSMNSDLPALWRQYQAAVAEHEANDLEPEDDPAWQRYIDALYAIEAARPADLAGLAVQASMIADRIATGRRSETVPVAAHVAEQLTALAVPGAVTLKPNAVAAIRDALVAAIEHHGGDVDHEPDPGMSEFVVNLENKARVALTVLGFGGDQCRDIPATIA